MAATTYRHRVSKTPIILMHKFINSSSPEMQALTCSMKKPLISSAVQVALKSLVLQRRQSKQLVPLPKMSWFQVEALHIQVWHQNSKDMICEH